jgi:UDP-N-acetylglucosamine acyltransferase
MIIDNTAIIKEGAKIGYNVRIGPYCVIGPEVELADNIELKSHVVIDGETFIGSNTVIYPFASIGSKTQDLKNTITKARLIIGTNNIIREYVTINSGNVSGITIVGNNCLFMASSHVGHDCIIGNNVILANCAAMAGHVILEDYVRIGGLAAVHQYGRVGAYSILGGVSGLARDLIPFGMAIGERATLRGINLIGMRRSGFTNKEIMATQEAIDILFAEENSFNERIAKVSDKFFDIAPVLTILKFIKEDSKRAYCKLEKNEHRDEG